MKPLNRFVPQLLVLALPMAAAAVGAVFLGQDKSWDVRNYHYYSGFAFLYKPLNFDFAPAQVQSFFNPLLHVFSYLMMAHLPSKLIAVILGSIQGLNFYLVFRISQALFVKWANSLRFWIGLSCAAAGCYGAAFIAELGTTFGDSMMSILILSALLLLIRYLQSDAGSMPSRNALPAFAGALLGLSLALKLTVAVYEIAIIIAFTAFVLSSKRQLRALLFFIGALSVSFISVYGYWGSNLYHEYQNPIFPHMNAFFQSPFFSLENVRDARFLPRSWLQTYFYPFFFAQKNSLVSEIPMRDIRMAFCYVAFVILIAGAMVRRFRRFGSARNMHGNHLKSPIFWFMTAFFVISYIAWQVQFSIYRYLVVSELLAPLFLALVLERIIGKKLLVFSLSLVLNTAICAYVIPADFGRQDFDDAFLQVEYPLIKDFENCVVLMGGNEAISYIIPSAPVDTRFVRVASNFLHPGQNANLDDKIRSILQHYDREHTLVYLSNESERERVSKETGYYGVNIDEKNCASVRSAAARGALICATLPSDSPSESHPAPANTGKSMFEVPGGARPDVAPEFLAERDRPQ